MGTLHSCYSSSTILSVLGYAFSKNEVALRCSIPYCALLAPGVYDLAKSNSGSILPLLAS